MNFWKALLLAGGIFSTASVFAEKPLDLSRMSSTMVFAKLYEIGTSPEEYKGKIMRVEGVYQVAKDEVDGKNYHVLLISDAAACCNFSFEVQWLPNEKLPRKGSRVIVEGFFGFIYDDPAIIPQLRMARVVR